MPYAVSREIVSAWESTLVEIWAMVVENRGTYFIPMAPEEQRRRAYALRQAIYSATLLFPDRWPNMNAEVTIRGTPDGLLVVPATSRRPGGQDSPRSLLSQLLARLDPEREIVSLRIPPRVNPFTVATAARQAGWATYPEEWTFRPDGSRHATFLYNPELARQLLEERQDEFRSLLTSEPEKTE